MHEKEIWKDIPGYEGLYQVNQWGEGPIIGMIEILIFPRN